MPPKRSHADRVPPGLRVRARRLSQARSTLQRAWLHALRSRTPTLMVPVAAAHGAHLRVRRTRDVKTSGRRRNMSGGRPKIVGRTTKNLERHTKTSGNARNPRMVAGGHALHVRAELVSRRALLLLARASAALRSPAQSARASAARRTFVPRSRARADTRAAAHTLQTRVVRGSHEALQAASGERVRALRAVGATGSGAMHAPRKPLGGRFLG